jgi:hypothetical protein
LESGRHAHAWHQCEKETTVSFDRARKNLRSPLARWLLLAPALVALCVGLAGPSPASALPASQAVAIFADVPTTHPYYAEIEAIYKAGYTAGCNANPLMYCPDATMNRSESAVFIERGIHSANYDPPAPSSQVFADLGLDSWAAKWVTGLYQDQYTAGCGTNPLMYCPWQGHTRAEGAVFYLRMLHGATYEPPQPAERTFADVPLSAWYAKWVAAAFGAGLITACESMPEMRFCPDDPLTRGLAAYMMYRARSAPERVFYVSPAGSDNNPGTLTQPFKTLSKGTSVLRPGDLLYLRGGTYQQRLRLASSGTALQPIVVSGYPGETAIIDGANYTIPGSEGTPLVELLGSYLKVSDLTVTGSSDMGVGSYGPNNTVSNVFAHHNWGWGIVLTGDDNLVQGSRAWSNSMMNYGATMSGGWGGGITCCRYPERCTIRNNTSWENWGEGISTFEATYTTIEGNTSYDNQQNYYISDTKYSTMRRNLSYCTPDNLIDPYYPQNGILVGDEKGVLIDGARYPSSDNHIVNNMVVGCDHNLAASAKASTNDLYAYNTFVNADSAYNPEPGSLQIWSGTPTNMRFFNNIIVQEDSRPIALIESSAVVFSNNLWSKNPGPAAWRTGDIVGDPKLSKIGSIEQGLLTASYFTISELSPARGQAMVLPEVTDDFFGRLRDSLPDIGAHEY